jgi:transcription termination/antitermination protein NusA
VRIHHDINLAEVIVPDFQLSLAIGKEGQNARLAARLTGVRVDIRGETQHAEGPVDDLDADYEEGEWVANAETGEMEWHAADGTVLTQKEWNEQAAAAPVADEATAEADTAEADSSEADTAEADSSEAEDSEADAPESENPGEGDVVSE